MMRGRLLLFLLLLAAACAQPPVRDDVTIDFAADSDAVTVTAVTRFSLNPRSPESRVRVESARQAALAGTDEWSVRFARLTPETERVTIDRTRGVLESVGRSVKIHSDELQRVFPDVTVQLTEGEGWRELALYPGTSSRASREQQRAFNEQMTAWSGEVTRYFNAVYHLYAYLDEHPGRAKYVFGALSADRTKDLSEVALTEDEEPLANAVVDAMEEIGTRMDEQNQRSETFAEVADLMFNPFPARVAIRVPRDAIAVEGFTRTEKSFVIEPVDLLESVRKLDGKWISPDPLVYLLRDDPPSAEDLARMPRRARLVSSPTEVATALQEQLVRPRSYVIRWRD